MNFDKFESVDNTFDRKPNANGVFREQDYTNMKYRKAAKKVKEKDADGNVLATKEVVEGRFYIANERFTSLGLAGLGMRQFTAPDGETVLAVVDDKFASIFKSSKKSKEGNKVKNFKSPKLEAALEKAGVLNSSNVGENQYIDFEVLATNATIKGISCHQVLGMKKGLPKAEAPSVAASGTTVSPTPKVEATPTPQAAPAGDGW